MKDVKKLRDNLLEVRNSASANNKERKSMPYADPVQRLYAQGMYAAELLEAWHLKRVQARQDLRDLVKILEETRLRQDLKDLLVNKVKSACRLLE
jgi:hypothetical protein